MPFIIHDACVSPGCTRPVMTMHFLRRDGCTELMLEELDEELEVDRSLPRFEDLLFLLPLLPPSFPSLATLSSPLNSFTQAKLSVSSAARRLDCAHVCNQVSSALDATVLSPSELPSSNVAVNMRMRGLLGMYAFCVAVSLSIVIGMLVELEAVFRRYARNHTRERRRAAWPRPGRGKCRWTLLVR